MKLAQMQSDQEDLMASHMTSFVESSQGMLTAARRTIESDLAEMAMRTRSVTAQRTQWMHQRLRIAPWALLTASLIGVVALIAISLTWTWQMQRMEMAAFGLRAVTLNDQTYLILDPSQIRIANCTTAGRPITCLRVLN
jgi:hypothetical protein